MDFVNAHRIVARWEGGYSDHPSDPGGATNYGITIGVLSEWRGLRVTKQDVKNLTLQEAGAIFRDRYWDVLRCDELPEEVRLIVFDCAVNQGPGRAVEFLQKSVEVAVDGKFGPKTMAAIHSHNKLDLKAELARRRLDHYYNLAHKGGKSVFEKGWLNRLVDICCY